MSIIKCISGLPVTTKLQVSCGLTIAGYAAVSTNPVALVALAALPWIPNIMDHCWQKKIKNPSRILQDPIISEKPVYSEVEILENILVSREAQQFFEFVTRLYDKMKALDSENYGGHYFADEPAASTLSFQGESTPSSIDFTIETIADGRSYELARRLADESFFGIPAPIHSFSTPPHPQRRFFEQVIQRLASRVRFYLGESSGKLIWSLKFYRNITGEVPLGGQDCYDDDKNGSSIDVVFYYYNASHKKPTFLCHFDRRQHVLLFRGISNMESTRKIGYLQS